MKKYEFRLKRVLRVRQIEAEREKAILAQMLAEVERWAEFRREIARQRKEAAEAARQPRTTGIELVGNDQFQAYAKRADGQVAQKQRLAQAQVDAQRMRCLEANRRLKALEKLEQKARANWQTEFQKEIEQFTAEVFLSRWKPPAVPKRGSETPGTLLPSLSDPQTPPEW